MLNNTKTQSRPKLLFLVPAISQTHKSLENSQDFFCQDQDQDQDQDFYLKTKIKTLSLKTKTKTKTLFFVLEAPRDQDFGLEDYITGYSNHKHEHGRNFELITKYRRKRKIDNFIHRKQTIDHRHLIANTALSHNRHLAENFLAQS